MLAVGGEMWRQGSLPKINKQIKNSESYQIDILSGFLFFNFSRDDLWWLSSHMIHLVLTPNFWVKLNLCGRN